MYTKGDFHIHSTASDGALSPKQIIQKAKNKKLDIISLTDHNNMSGIHEAVTEGSKLGIKVIPGVELSSRFYDIRVHILGYFPYEKNDDDLFAALSYVKNHNLNKFNKLLTSRLNISYRRQHISIEKGINLLKHFGATVILAHPVLLPRKFFQTIASMGFDGIEAKYALNSKDDTEFFLNYAKNSNMIYTAGSDFHTNNELYRAHGNLGDVYLNEDEIKIFLNYVYRQQ